MKYLNYISENKPEYIDRTMQYHVSYVKDDNKKMLSAMEHYNSLVDLYIERLNSPIYSKVASRDKEYDKFTQVSPFDLTDYLVGISSAWDLEELSQTKESLALTQKDKQNLDSHVKRRSE